MAHIFKTFANRLTVGSQTAALITNPQKIPYEGATAPFGGLSILNGPVQIGIAPLSPVPKGVLDVGPTVPTSGPIALSAINVTHPVKGIQITSTAIGFQVAAPTNIVLGNINITGAVAVTGTITATATITGSEVIASGITLTSRKAFDILHPLKSGYRLRHLCLEGPESGVYHRGRLTGKNVIDLPDYWQGLVDPETITVNLTQIKSSQDLIVEKIEWGRKIIIKSGNGTTIDCYYIIHAERSDGEKLIVEYEGTSIDDYPGDNSIYSINK